MLKSADTLDVLVRMMSGEPMDDIIPDQEKQGQRDLVYGRNRLPKNMQRCTKSQFEQMGIQFVGEHDDLFYDVVLPDGWKINETQHSMWSKLVDEQGRERASVFYKAAYYDRHARISLATRYNASYAPMLGWDNPKHYDGGWKGVATDCGVLIWESEPIEKEPDSSARDNWLAWCERRDNLAVSAENWLDGQHPDWRNPLAYW